ncbi:MAG: hypothetical protein HPY85_11855 [Anaerolineae bacterium]|nr:hypothetical protein [Anaerolineae bacterium]
MKKSIYTLLIIILVLAFALTACKPAAEESATDVPAAEETNTEAPAEETEDPADEEEVAEPTEAEEEVVENGVSVWDTGFRVTFGYNEGNDMRRVVAEILRDSVAQVNPNFVIEVQALPWPNYLEASRAHQLPFGTTGWLEDYHDPHNWYQPYLTGYYAASYGIPEELTSKYAEYLEDGLAAIGDFDARSAVYAALNQELYSDATFIPGYMAEGRHYEQEWVEGYYYNPLYSNFYYYPLSKTDAAPDPNTMYVGGIGQPDTLDPAIDYETGGGEVLQNVYETLVWFEHTSGNEFFPQLATDWSVAEDGLTYTFTIREGVTFHEGGELTPEDVEWSIERGMLNGYAWSPQWMITSPMFGVDDVSELVNALDENVPAFATREEMQAGDPDVLMQVCQTVKDSIEVTEDGQVVFHTAKKAPFIPAMAHTGASIMDMEWAIEQGAWDGDCATWQNYYSTTEEESPFYEITNGTGPFKLGTWDHATSEVTLLRNDNYWRTEEIGPAWEGGPVGNAKLERVVLKTVEEWGTRLQMMLSGDLDMNYVDRQYISQVDPYVHELLLFDIETGDFTPADELLPGMGTDTSDVNLTLFKGAVGANRVEIYFNYDIQSVDGSNPFIGSGTLDGSGIPADFFSNVHVRRAFSYCFDPDLFIEEVLQGEGVRPTGATLPGMEGYNWDDPLYTYDLDKCAEEFQKAIFELAD